MSITILANIVSALAFIAVLVYCYLTRHFGYWERHGVYSPKPEVYFGNIRDLVLRRRAQTDVIREFYNLHKHHKVVGIYRMATPALVVTDLEIIKSILIKDFDHFLDRGIDFGKDGLGLNMFHADGETWRVLRSKFSPIFTSSKLKGMMPLMIQQTDKWMKYVEPLVARSPEVGVYSLVQKYTLGSIGSCAFGMDIPCEELDHNGNVYSKLDNLIFQRHFTSLVDNLLPGILKKLNISIMSTFVTDFFNNLVKRIMLDRKETTSSRKDFMDLIIDIRSEGKLHGARREKGEVTTLEVTDSMIAAQAFVFYAAGYVTSATTAAFLLHELAYHPDIQDRLVKEIQQMLKDHDGQYTFEGLKGLQYMGQVINETLRINPIVDPLLRRLVSKSYLLPGTDITIEKGTVIMIPVRGIQHDPQYWPEPELFDPDRFSEENSVGRHPCSWLPFGTGPRNCIGMRFAQVQTRLLLSRLLSRYRVEPASNTKQRHVFDPHKTVVVGIREDFPLKLVPRNPSTL